MPRLAAVGERDRLGLTAERDLRVLLRRLPAQPLEGVGEAYSVQANLMLDNGVRVMVPPFVESGEKIVVDTAEVSYVKRAD